MQEATFDVEVGKQVDGLDFGALEAGRCARLPLAATEIVTD